MEYTKTLIDPKVISRRAGWAALLMFACVGAYGQGTGKLRLFCEPAGGSYVVDGKHRLSDREITLMEGPHRLVFWAPERRMLDTTVTVNAGTTKDVKVHLHYSPEYIAYRHKAEHYERNDRWMHYGPPVLAVGSGVLLGVSAMKVINARKDLDALRTEYADSADPGAIETLKTGSIPDANEAYRNARTMAYVSGGVFVLSAGLTAYVRSLRNDRKPPVFEDQEKLRFDGLVWVPGTQGAGTWAMGLTIPIR